MITLPDGSTIETDDGGNIISYNGQPADRIPSRLGGNNRGPQIATSAGGTDYVNPSLVDFSSLRPAYVDFGQSLDRAHQEGTRNRGIYYGELTGADARNAALGLVDTDIEGINRGLNAMIPRIRREGDEDLRTNISRAGTIDDFNLDRIPSFNSFNRGQVSANNQFNRDEFAESVAGSGVDYLRRVSGTMDRLEQRARGDLPDDLARELDFDLQNRGVGLLRGTGINPGSGAGIRANARLTISERLGMSERADAQLPGVAGQSQQLLQAPFERAPTVLSQPTNVPLNVSNVADRIPIQSNISAGSAQQQIASAATELQTISPSTILGSSLQTEQFNEASRYTRDLGVLDRQQGQLTAVDNAAQGAINADNAAQIRDEAYSAFQSGFGVRQSSADANALGGVTGVLQGVAALAGLGGGGSYGSGGGGGGVGTSGGSGGGGTGIFEQVGNAVQQGVGLVTGIIDSVFSGNSGGSGDRADGGFDVSRPTIDNDEPLNIPGVISEQPLARTASSGESTATPADSLARAFSRSITPFGDVNRDLSRVSKTANDINNWSRYSPPERAAASGDLGIDILEKQRVISGDRANQIRTAQGAVNTLTTDGATNGQRAAAVATLGNLAISTPFTGPVNAPETVGGVPVTEATENGFKLADGTIVPKQTLLDSSNAASTIQAFSVLTSKADKDQKLTALTSIGIKASAANELIDQVDAGNANAALSLFQTANNWDQMSPVQQAVSITQTSSAILNAAAGSTASSAAQGSGALAYLSPAANAATTAAVYAGGAYAAYKGITDHMNTIEAMDHMTKSERGKAAAKLGATSGNSVGFAGLDPISAGIGYATLAATGSGKNRGQMNRDSWRDSLEQQGLAKKNKNGSHEVKLADGTLYDIGRDGGAKLANKGVNIDGRKDRNTFDVDWSNPIAKETIPEAHLYAIATGLDPTANSQADTFDRAVAQGLNGATSNADSVEGVRQNFKAMLENKDPRQIASRIEMLRLQNHISEEEYGIYLDRTNRIFGTNIQPTDRKKALTTIVSQIKKTPAEKWSSEIKALYSALTDIDAQASSKKKLEQRLAARR